jgi:hypothetical protein
VRHGRKVSIVRQPEPGRPAGRSFNRFNRRSLTASLSEMRRSQCTLDLDDHGDPDLYRLRRARTNRHISMAVLRLGR